MSRIADRLFRRTPSEADALMAQAMARPFSDPWSRPVAPIGQDQALAHSAVWGSATLITDLIGTMPYYAQKEVDGRMHRLAVQPELLVNPSRQQGMSPIAWRCAVLWCMIQQGNACGMVTDVTMEGDIVPTKIELFDPKRLSYRKPTTTIDGVIGAPGQFLVDGKPQDPWPFGLLWHQPGYVLPGSPLGLSVLKYAASSIGLGIAAEAFGRDWFTDGAHPSGILQYKGKDGDATITDEQAEQAKARWRQMFANRRDPAVLGGTWDYTQVSIDHEDSQFLETIAANIATVARFYRIPPEMIGGTSGNALTYANLEGRMTSLLRLTLDPWRLRLEEGLSRLMSPGVLVVANANGLIAPDALTQARIDDMQIKNGVDSPNDVLQRQGRDTYEGGDVHNWPPDQKTLPAEGEADSTMPPGAVAPNVPGGNLA